MPRLLLSHCYSVDEQIILLKLLPSFLEVFICPRQLASWLTKSLNLYIKLYGTSEGMTGTIPHVICVYKKHHNSANRQPRLRNIPQRHARMGRRIYVHSTSPARRFFSRLRSRDALAASFRPCRMTFEGYDTMELCGS